MTVKFVLKLKLTVLLIWQKHSFDFSGRDQNSGIYFYKLTAGTNTYCKKIALVK